MQEILDLSDAEQERLLKRLTRHALCLMKPLWWRGASIKHGGSVPGGHEPQDFAVDSFQKALDGTRTWNRDTYATLEDFLRSIIHSDINHLATSLDNSTTRRIAPLKPTDDCDEAERIKGSEVQPPKAVIDNEAHTRFYEAAEKLLDGDKFLFDLLECMEAEITGTAEIAQLMGISEDDVTNGKKRLRRKLDPLFHPKKKDKS